MMAARGTCFPLFCLAFLAATFVSVTSSCAIPYDLLGSGRMDWQLIFRGTAGVNQSVYDTFMNGNAHTAELGCMHVNNNMPCTTHFRSNVIDQWQNIAYVAVALFKNGHREKLIVFNGQGTNKENWFTHPKVVSSDWTDLQTATTNIFALRDPNDYKRDFFINKIYNGCPNDVGWMVAVDQATPPCGWEQSRVTNGFPQFLYTIASNDAGNWNRGSDIIGIADVLAVFIKRS